MFSLSQLAALTTCCCLYLLSTLFLAFSCNTATNKGLPTRFDQRPLFLTQHHPNFLTQYYPNFLKGAQLVLTVKPPARPQKLKGNSKTGRQYFSPGTNFLKRYRAKASPGIFIPYLYFPVLHGLHNLPSPVSRLLAPSAP